MSKPVQRRRRSLLALACGLALVLPASAPAAGPRPPVAQAQATTELPVEALTDLEQLRTRFNNDVGKVRLLLLLSPT